MNPTQYIINPASNGGMGLKVWNRFNAAWAEPIDPAHVAFTEHIGHAQKLAAEMPECDVIVVAGGDGTIGEVISGIMDRPEPRPHLAIIPCGTGNDIARCAGVLSLEDATRALRDVETSAFDLIRIERETDGRTEQRHAFLFANAGFSAIPMMRPWMKRILGAKGAYYFSTVLAMIRFRPPHMVVDIDGQKHEGPTFLVLVGNAEYAAGGTMRIAPNATTDDGLLNITLIQPLPLHRLITKLFSRMADGTHLNEPEVSYIEGKQIHIQSDPAALLDLDGEPFGLTPATISVQPRALNLVRHNGRPESNLINAAVKQ